MKYSGIEWIGEIPDNWEIRKVKQCFYISKEQAHDENPTVLSLARAGVYESYFGLFFIPHICPIIGPLFCDFFCDIQHR